jgi:tetraprenyl-beta-curcumene synthase
MDRQLAARAGFALVLANARYWSGVAPLVRRQMSHWRARARAIEDPILRALALEKLSEEGFNAEAAAMLATLAPPAHRRSAVDAIVAAEVLYDYLDGLTESPSQELPDDGHCLFRAFSDAVAPAVAPSGNYYRYHSRSHDCGYLDELVSTVRLALAGLPAITRLAEILKRSAARGAEAQLHIHAAALAGPHQLEQWAKVHAIGTTLQWREFLAGAACSVLAVHALIAAAADRTTTHAQALEIDRIYLSISVLPTILDSVMDYERDAHAGRPGYVRYYADRSVLAERLENVIGDAVAHARSAPHGAHHVMNLVGVVAYYTSSPTARSDFACPITDRIVRQLQPLIAPTLGVMRAWRAAKQMRRRWRPRLPAIAGRPV